MSEPYVIAVTQRKGGDGKTTIATHLAAGLAIRGAKVCLIDTDPQGDASRLLGLRPADGLYRWLAEGADVVDVLVPVADAAFAPPGEAIAGALVLVPGSSLTAAISAVNDNRFSLAERIQELAGAVDVIVLDTAPTLSVFDVYVKLAADGFLFVTQPEHLSLEGLADGFAEAERVSAMRVEAGYAPARPLGIVSNKVRGNTDAHRYFMEVEIGQRYGALAWTPAIMLRTVFTQAAALGRTVFRHRPGCSEALDLMQIVAKAQEAMAR